MLALSTWLLLFVSATLVFVLCLAKTTFRRKRREGEPPLVDGSLIWGNATQFSQHAVDFLHQAKKRHGNVFTIRLINQYLTIIMEPNSYETMSQEKNFDFEPINDQVNLNIFQVVLKDSQKMIKDTGKTVRGKNLEVGIDNFARNLNSSCDQAYYGKMDAAADCNGSVEKGMPWVTDGLRAFTANTAFSAIFNTVFGRSNGQIYDTKNFYSNFEVFHKHFNHLWLGLPKICFPSAMAAFRELLLFPHSDVLLARDDLSSYMRLAIEHMRQHGHTEKEISSHSLIFLHVNYNTFRLSFWTLNNLLEDAKARDALLEEIHQEVEQRFDSETNTAEFTIQDIENMKILDSVVQETCRLASGVFMVRYVKEDTTFKTSDGKEHLIRQGDRVAIYPPAIHKDPEIFEDPLVFKYDRFVDATFYKDGEAIKHPIIPFGSLCPGKRYALLQVKWYIMTVMTRFDIHLHDGQHAQYDYQYHGHEVLPPVKDVQVDFRQLENFPLLRLHHR